MDEATEGFESFVEVVTAGNISAAARALDVPRETLSRRLKRLEERLGVRLLHRGTRQLTLTAAGQTLFHRARPLVAAAREAQLAVQRLDDVPRGLLRVTAPPARDGQEMSRMFFQFLDAFPEVDLEVHTSARHVDLIAEGFDVGLRAGFVRDPRLVARVLHETPVRAFASTAYLDRRGRPATLDDLHHHDLLVGMDQGLRTTPIWPLQDGGTVEVRGRMSANNLDVLHGAMRDGRGICLVPGHLLRRSKGDAPIETVLPQLVGTTARLSVVFVERELMPAKVRAFVDHLVQWSREHPW